MSITKTFERPTSEKGVEYQVVAHPHTAGRVHTPQGRPFLQRESGKAVLLALLVNTAETEVAVFSFLSAVTLNLGNRDRT